MSIWHLIVLLVVVVLIFGTGKLRNIGGDLGGAMRDFKKGLNGGEDDEDRRKRDEERLRADAVPPPEGTTQSQRDSSDAK
jgi:sec-independent protein translocase protein TatA